MRRWIGFSEDDGEKFAEGARLGGEAATVYQRVEEQRVLPARAIAKQPRNADRRGDTTSAISREK